MSTQKKRNLCIKKFIIKKTNKKNYFLYLRPFLGAWVERQWRTMDERVLTDNLGCFFLRDMNCALVKGLALRDVEAFFLAGIF